MKGHCWGWLIHSLLPGLTWLTGRTCCSWFFLVSKRWLKNTRPNMISNTNLRESGPYFLFKSELWLHMETEHCYAAITKYQVALSLFGFHEQRKFASECLKQNDGFFMWKYRTIQDWLVTDWWVAPNWPASWFSLHTAFLRHLEGCFDRPEVHGLSTQPEEEMGFDEPCLVTWWINCSHYSNILWRKGYQPCS